MLSVWGMLYTGREWGCGHNCSINGVTPVSITLVPLHWGVTLVVTPPVHYICPVTRMLPICYSNGVSTAVSQYLRQILQKSMP